MYVYSISFIPKMHALTKRKNIRRCIFSLLEIPGSRSVSAFKSIESLLRANTKKWTVGYAPALILESSYKQILYFLQKL